MVHVHQSKLLYLWRFIKVLEQSSDHPWGNLTIDEFDFFQMVWQPFLKNGSENLQRVQIYRILLVNKGLEVAQFGHSCEYFSKLVAIDPIIIQK